MTRIDRPPAPKKDSDGKPTTEEFRSEFYSGWSFTKRAWPIWLMLLWIILVCITTETYIHAFKVEKELPPNEASPGIIVTS